LVDQVRHAGERGQQLISLGSQPVIVVVDARDLGLQGIQAPKVGAKPLVLLGPFSHQAVDLLMIEAEEPADFRGDVGMRWAMRTSVRETEL
jgi:hypothetical protein